MRECPSGKTAHRLWKKHFSFIGFEVGVPLIKVTVIRRRPFHGRLTTSRYRSPSDPAALILSRNLPDSRSFADNVMVLPPGILNHNSDFLPGFAPSGWSTPG